MAERTFGVSSASGMPMMEMTSLERAAGAAAALSLAAPRLATEPSRDTGFESPIFISSALNGPE